MGDYRSKPDRSLAEVKRLWQACDDAAKALQQDLARRDELGAEVAAFAARAKLTAFEDELAAAADEARSLMPDLNDDYRARVTPKLAALVGRIDARGEELRKAACPDIAIERPAPLPSDPTDDARRQAYDQLQTQERELEAAREQLAQNLSRLEERQRRQQKRAARPGTFESKAAFHYDLIVEALKPVERISPFAVGKQLRAMHPIDRAKLRGQAIAMGVALVLCLAFFAWLALR